MNRRQQGRRTAGVGASLCRLAIPVGLVLAAPPTPLSSQLGPTATTTAASDAPALTPIVIDPPAARGSSSPALAVEGATTVTRQPEILVTWLAPGASGRRLMFARRSGESWGLPITVTEGVRELDSADRPSLTVLDTQAVRRTLIARTGDVVARSGDGGRTWSRLPAEPLPFASFAGGDEGGYVFWLAADPNGPARLLGSRVLAGEAVLDAEVTGGSPTAAAMTWDGPIVAYRDVGAQRARDIAVVRRQDARWTPPRPVRVEGWRPRSEPKSGPAVAAERRRVAVAWYTASANRPRLVVAFSSDAGRSFSSPVEVDVGRQDGAPLGPVAVDLEEGGDALVLWLRSKGESGATLDLARVSVERGSGGAVVLASAPREELTAGLPQLAVADDRVAAAWVEGEPGRVRAVAVPLAGIPAVEAARRTAVRAERPRAAPGPGEVGRSAPALELVSLAGAKVSLRSLRGRVVLLNLWATWCLPCRAEMPELVELEERYGAQGLSVVGVSVDGADDTAKVQAFVSEYGLPFGIWLDPEMRLYRALRVVALPTTFVADRSGAIVWRRDGTITADDPGLVAALEGALGRKR